VTIDDRVSVASILPVCWAVTDNLRSLLIDEAARLLGLSKRTVYYRIREGRLRTLRTRGGSQRVLVASIEVLLRETRAREDARLKRLLRGRTDEASSETEPLPL
jgi:excisionase family DNA binding protein